LLSQLSFLRKQEFIMENCSLSFRFLLSQE
jgi:hypothetical protein